MSWRRSVGCYHVTIFGLNNGYVFLFIFLAAANDLGRFESVSERHHDDGEAVDMFSQVMMVFLARRVIKHSVHVLG
ncbi:hypothetical protein S245_022810 [Arachis hypogaea]